MYKNKFFFNISKQRFRQVMSRFERAVKHVQNKAEEGISFNFLIN